MNPEIKQRWINALRSGDYAQTRGALHRLEETMEHPAGYCCLGVLCEIAVEDGVVVRTPVGTHVPAVGYVSSDPTNGWIDQDVLPEVVKEWAGLKTRNPRVQIGPENTVISEINDTHRMTFPEIANLIKDQL